MKNIQEFSIPALIDGVLRINKKVTENYFKNNSGYHNDNRDILLTYFNFISKIAINPHEIAKIQKTYSDYFQNLQKMWGHIFLNQDSQTNFQASTTQKEDKRFLGKAWNEYPYFNFIKQNYLLLEKLAEQIIEEVEIDDKTKKKLEFYTEQYMDILSPANFLATNPEALKLAIETKGESLWKGFNNLVHDIEKGKITQTDESAFEVGKNLAITKGAVIYENELMQLIQYSPSTEKVYETPLLMIPSWINKYYVLDLQPHSSFVKYFIDQGFTIFIISWRNPESGMGNLTMDDYVEKGVLQAIKVVETISHSDKVNTLGYCLGGTLLSIALSILSTKEKTNPINYATFLASLVDFSDVGPMGNVINDALVRRLESGELLSDGVFHGYDMERAFNLIRANDLVWKYVTDDYLEGKVPTAFDVMYWTNDNTNLPAKMYLYYIKNIVFNNLLSVKNALTICDTPIDIGNITVPVCVIGFTEDYISPAKTVFKTTELVSGPAEFILGGSGHVMGATNYPSKNKYAYYLNGKLGKGIEEWKKTAVPHEGSWWIAWSERLSKNSGKQIPAPAEPGNEKYKMLESAPGTYAKKKCQESFKHKNQIQSNHINHQTNEKLKIHF
jgi:polyhydroxyalkanoate synthase